MLGCHRKTRLLSAGVLAGAAGTLAAVGVALVTLDSGAFGSSSVRGHERSVDIVYALGAGPDGKLVVAGLFSSSRYDDFALARYTARGRLDRSFGQGGKVLTSFGAHTRADASAVAIQPDGKIVVAGTDLTNTRPSVGVYEFAL